MLSNQGSRVEPRAERRNRSDGIDTGRMEVGC